MLLSAALSIIERASKTTTWTETHRRDGLRVAGNLFMRDTMAVRTSGNVTIASGATSLSVAGLTGFRWERLLRVDLVGEWSVLGLKSWRSVSDAHRRHPKTDTPTWIAHDTDAAAVIYPTADAAYTARFVYAQAFTDVTSGDTALNIPDEYLPELLTYGATAATEHKDPDDLYGDPSWQKFLAFIEQVKDRCRMPIGEVVFSDEEYL